MAKTVASRKSKGRRLQQEVVSALKTAFPDLTIHDLRSTPMGVATEDVWLSEAAKRCFPYAIEAKNCEKLAIWQALQQSEQPNREGTPLLIFRRNHSDTYCCVKFNHFLNIVKELNELRNQLRSINE